MHESFISAISPFSHTLSMMDQLAAYHYVYCYGWAEPRACLVRVGYGQDLILWPVENCTSPSFHLDHILPFLLPSRLLLPLNSVGLFPIIVIVNTVLTHGPVRPAANSSSGVHFPEFLSVSHSAVPWTSIMDPHKPMRGVTVDKATSLSIYRV